MPTWGMHLLTAKKLLNKIPKKLETSDNEFKIGNLLPDIPNGFVIKNISLNMAHSATHFENEITVGSHKEKRTDIKGFFDKYHNKFSNPLIIGYYTHLLTDAYWNNKTYGEKAILDSDKKLKGINLKNGQKLICEQEKIRKLKSDDFKLYAYTIFKKHLIDEIKYTEKIEEMLKEVNWMPLKKEDIIKTIEYIKEKIVNPESIIKSENLEYQIYSEQEIKEGIEDSIDYIIKFL